MAAASLGEKKRGVRNLPPPRRVGEPNRLSAGTFHFHRHGSSPDLAIKSVGGPLALRRNPWDNTRRNVLRISPASFLILRRLRAGLNLHRVDPDSSDGSSQMELHFRSALVPRHRAGKDVTLPRGGKLERSMAEFGHSHVEFEARCVGSGEKREREILPLAQAVVEQLARSRCSSGCSWSQAAP